MGKSNYSKAALCLCGWKWQEKETIEGELDAAQWKMHQDTKNWESIRTTEFR